MISALNDILHGQEATTCCRFTGSMATTPTKSPRKSSKFTTPARGRCASNRGRTRTFAATAGGATWT